MNTPRIGQRKKWKLTLVKAKRVTLLKKLNDPNDKDDLRWVARRLAGTEKIIEKKEKAKSQKKRDKKSGPPRRLKRSPES